MSALSGFIMLEKMKELFFGGNKTVHNIKQVSIERRSTVVPFPVYRGYMYNKYLTNLVFSVRTVSYRPCFFLLISRCFAHGP